MSEQRDVYGNTYTTPDNSAPTANSNITIVKPGGERVSGTWLAAAGAAGFTVPTSDVFVGKEFALKACEDFERLVAKPIAVKNIPALGDDPDRYRVMFTMAVEPAVVASCDEVEFLTPTFFQKRVPAGTEFRVIGFRDRCFCYRNTIPVETRLRPDERLLLGDELGGRSIQNAQFTPAEPWPEIEKLVARYLECMEIEYGAFDIIVTSEGDHVFLECNPEGQWAAANGHNLNEIASHFAKILATRLSISPYSKLPFVYNEFLRAG